MHFDHNNCLVDYCMNSMQLQNVKEEKDLGIIISDDLKSDKQCIGFQIFRFPFSYCILVSHFPFPFSVSLFPFPFLPFPFYPDPGRRRVRKLFSASVDGRGRNLTCNSRRGQRDINTSVRSSIARCAYCTYCINVDFQFRFWN